MAQQDDQLETGLLVAEAEHVIAERRAAESYASNLSDLDEGASSLGSVFTLCNSAIGAGVLSLPYAFKCAGAPDSITTDVWSSCRCVRRLEHGIHNTSACAFACSVHVLLLCSLFGTASAVEVLCIRLDPHIWHWRSHISIDVLTQAPSAVSSCVRSWGSLRV